MIIQALQPLIRLLIAVYCLLHAATGLANSQALGASSWESWILQEHPTHHCPWELSNDNRKTCVWPGVLAFDITDTEGTFSYTVDVYSPQAISSLPGNAVHWPAELMVNGKAARIVEQKGSPAISLTQGTHNISGRFIWKQRPRQLTIPENTAIISLAINGKTQHADRRGNQLIFSKNERSSTEKTNDSLHVDVFRLMTDGVPVTVNTHIRLSVSGKAREVTIGRAMLDSTEVLSINSPIPARIEADGNLRAQVTPGEHTIEINARFTTSPSIITTQKITEYWPTTEYISFQSAPLIRQAKLSGAASVDTSQITIPTHWSQFPTYQLNEREKLQIATEFRGDHSPAANTLSLKRDLWLDFDGKGITSFDRINGEMNQDWRLNIANNVTLGRATVDNKAVLITNDKGAQGIEIRSPSVQVEAIARIDATSNFSASGWQANVADYTAKLHLPPGWRVFHASGVDQIWGTWVSQWDLWDVFLLLIIVSVTRRLLGNKIAALSAVTFLIALHESGTPLFITPVLLIIIALLPIISGKFKRGLRNTGALFSALLVLMVIGFAVDRFRLAIYPSLEQAQVGTYHQTRAYSRVKQSTQSSQILMESADMAAVETRSANSPSIESEPLRKHKNLYEVTENDRVQTGPGQPNWTWNAIQLRANGPVSIDQTLSIYYSSPLLTSIWLVLSVLLVFAYSAVLITRLLQLSEWGSTLTPKDPDKPSSQEGNEYSSTATALCIGLAIMASLSYSPNSIASTLADSSFKHTERSHTEFEQNNAYPPAYLLNQLKERLTKAPLCLPDCVSLNNGEIRVESNRINITFTAYADTHIALPLPNGDNSWELLSVEQEGKTLPLQQSGNRRLVALPQGHHTLTLKGKIIGDRASIRLPIPIHNLSAFADGWVIDGLIDGRASNNTLTLRAIDPETTTSNTADTLKASPPPTFARVIRHFTFGKRWTVNTTVVRETTQGAVSLAINLLPNERPLQDVGIINDRNITLQFQHNQRRIRWSSSLDPSQAMRLEAAQQSSYVEEWSFTPSSLWRLEYDGIPPRKPQVNSNAFEPRFAPWPGEVLNISIRKPEGVAGAVHTVERATLQVEPGNNLQRSTLTLTIRASIGTDYPITLPNNAEVLKFSIDGRAMNTPANNNIVAPLQPREQTLEVVFQVPQRVAVISRSPQILLPDSASNIVVEYRLPRDRWPLYVNGPAIGPAMLYWGVLLVIILAALGLPYLTRRLALDVPISTIGWLLLGLGLSTINSYGVLVIAIMFLLLSARKQYINPLSMSRLQFNTLQIGIFLWVAFALISVLIAIPMGLLSTPEMKVVGNGSSSHFYRYYQDGSGGELPIATVVSVPLFAYRVVMLLWALWLSTRLIQWAIWTWQCVKEKGVWQTKPPQEKKLPVRKNEKT
ncbi:hypothetical protein ACVBE9_11830 [Eionea flava]